MAEQSECLILKFTSPFPTYKDILVELKWHQLFLLTSDEQAHNLSQIMEQNGSVFGLKIKTHLHIYYQLIKVVSSGNNNKIQVRTIIK